MKHTFKVYPAGMSREVYRVIEIAGSKTLDDLCEAILWSFDFIHEHLYEFCMDNRMYSAYSYQPSPAAGEPSTNVSIDSIRLQGGQNFSLHYDFGDDWMFTIHVQKMEVTETEPPTRVIKAKGSIEQYPDWDLEDDYDDEEE